MISEKEYRWTVNEAAGEYGKPQNTEHPIIPEP